MLVTIRKDLKNEFVFSTDCGILVDNDAEYKARYNNGQDFQIWINEDWRNIEGIDFEFLPNENVVKTY